MFEQFAARGYRYKTSVVTDYDSKSAINGGVVIGSKWPIIREDQIVYRGDCSGADCLAAKGVKYARVIKTAPVGMAAGTVQNVSKVFNVFATHMQAWYTSDDKADRAKQAQQFKAFVDAQHLPPSEPALLCGDFNTDWVRYPGEVAQLVSLLNATIPTLTGDVRFTSDPATNLLVGRDGAADDCQDGYTQSWGPLDDGKTYQPSAATRVQRTAAWPPVTDTGAPLLPFFVRQSNLSFCPCCPSEWLDYVLWSNAHQPPLPDGQSPTLGAIALKLKLNASGGGGSSAPVRVAWAGTLQPVPDPPLASSYMELADLSDHYPVYGKFRFAVDGPAHEDIFGCRQNSDCSFHVSIYASCYCDGPGCTWNGTHVDGWAAGASSPVNDNCHYHPASLTCVCHKDPSVEA